MIKMFLSTSTLFLTILTIRKFFRGKAGNVFLYSLWLMFAAGLIIPVYSAVLQNITGVEKARLESPLSIMNLVKANALNADRADAPVQPKNKTSENPAEASGTKALKKGAADRKTVMEPAGNSSFPDWMELLQLNYILFFIWAAGTTSILIYQLLSARAFRRQLIENREEIHFHGQKAYMADGIKTPLLFRGSGLSSEIYLPKAIIENEILVKHAILHENIHRKHKDLLWGYVRIFLAAVYWFYPLVWIAAFLSKRDCEYACDSSVIKGMDRQERISYGNSLLSFVQAGRDQDLFFTSTAMKIGKSEMEARIRMIKNGRKSSLCASLFICLLLCAAGASAFTDAAEPDKEPVKAQKISARQPEQENMLSAKAAEFKLTDSWGSDAPQIYYEDDENMVFSGWFGLFVYSKKTEEIVQSLDLKEIGCHMTQGDHYCEISVSENGKTVYLHVVNDKKMYRYSIDTKELHHLDYRLPDQLHNRKKWENLHKSGILCTGSTIGDLAYWYEDKAMIRYQPLFYKPYGSCDFFKPEEIRDLSEVSFYADGKEYVITEKEKLKWIETHFSQAAKIKGAPACSFYHVMYLKRKDGSCGRIFPASDSCPVYQAGKSFYDYQEKTNETFWKLFGIKDISILH